jgi:hypothetical protein
MVTQMIKAHELQMGDEVIMSINSGLRYIRILSPVKLTGTSNYLGDPRCKMLKCSFHQKKVNIDGWMGTFDAHNPENHNVTKHFDLNGRDLWLVKRDGQKL